MHHLLRLSLVNKVWLKEIRLVLLKKRPCYLQIDGTNDIATQLQNANKTFRASSYLVPFNGLSISISSCGQEFQAKKETEILEQMYLFSEIFPLKYLQIKEVSNAVWKDTFESSCYIYSALAQLVLKNSSTLEELLVDGKQFRFFEIFHEIVKKQIFTMPRLKVLHPFDLCWQNLEDLTEAVGGLGKLISFAPNLSVISGDWSAVGLRALPGASSLVRRLVIDGEDEFSNELVSLKSSIHSIRGHNIYRLPYPHHIPEGN